MLLLTGFLATILMRVLKADFVKYSRDDGGSGQTGLVVVLVACVLASGLRECLCGGGTRVAVATATHDCEICC